MGIKNESQLKQLTYQRMVYVTSEGGLLMWVLTLNVRMIKQAIFKGSLTN